MGARHSSDSGGDAVGSADPMDSDAALTYALSMVSTTPISAFSSFWQSALRDSLSFSLATTLEPGDVAALIERASADMARNTVQSDNLRAMCTVLCMALEQYPHVQQHAAATAAAHTARIRSQRADEESEAAPAAPPTAPEPLHTLFERIYLHGETLPDPAATAGLSSPIAAAAASKRLLSAAPPDWLLDLATLLRLFLQHIVSEIEYGPRKIQLLSLRNIAMLERRDAVAARAKAAAGGGLAPQFPSHLGATPAASAEAAAASVSQIDLHSDLSYRLVHALLSALVDVPLSEASYELHVELANLVLVLLSAQMYVPMSPLYQHANIFMAHALCGPFARYSEAGSEGIGRCSEQVARLLNNCLQPMRAAQERNDRDLIAHRMAMPHTPSAALNVQRGSGAPTHGAESFSGNATPAAPGLSVSVEPSSAAATAASSFSSSSAASSGASAPAPSRPTGPSLTQRLNHLAGVGRAAPPLLKRLGSRLYSLLLLPVQLYKYLFSEQRFGASSGAAPPGATLLHDRLSVRSSLLLLLLAHQGLESVHTHVESGARVEDERGRAVVVGYRHRNAGQFSWRRWRDECDEEELRRTGNGSSADGAPFVPSSSAGAAPAFASAAPGASSIRATAPAVHLPSSGLYVRTDEHALGGSAPALSSGFAAAAALSLDANPYKHALSLLHDEEDDAEDDDAFDHVHSAAATPSFHGRTLFPTSSTPVAMLPFPSTAAHVAALPSRPAASLSFALLYDLFCASLPCDPATQLLYSCVAYNPAFREYVLVKMDLDRLVLPLVQRLYELYSGGNAANGAVAGGAGGGGGLGGSASSPSPSASASLERNRVYMLLILLLMLSEDRGFVDSCHRRLFLAAVPFYSEAHLTRASLASVSMLVLLKVAHANLYAGRDAYVHSNCIAILSNLANNHAAQQDVLPITQADGNSTAAAAAAPRTGGVPVAGVRLHPNVCFKLISLLAIVGKKYTKLQEKASRERAQAAAAAAALRRASNGVPHTPTSTPATASAASDSASLGLSRINLAPPSSLHVSHSAGTPSPAQPSPATATAALSKSELREPFDEDDPSIQASAATLELVANFSSFIRLLLEVVLASLTGRSLEANIYMLYSLVQSARVLQPFVRTPQFGDLADPLLALCDRSNALIRRSQAGGGEASSSDGQVDETLSSPVVSLSVEEIMQLLKAESRQLRAAVEGASATVGSSGGSGSGSGSAPHWQCFSYEEVPRSHDFFVPLLWECAWQLELVRGSGHHIVLFPGGSEDDEEEAEDAAASAAVGPVTVPSASVSSRSESGASVGVHDELLAAEMEQIYEEHALQRHIGDALTTPAAGTTLQAVLPSPYAQHATCTPTPAHLSNSAHSLRGHE